MELRGVLPTFGFETGTVRDWLRRALTQLWWSKRLLPEGLRGGRAVHGPLQGPCGDLVRRPSRRLVACQRVMAIRFIRGYRTISGDQDFFPWGLAETTGPLFSAY